MDVSLLTTWEKNLLMLLVYCADIKSLTGINIPAL